MFVLHHQTDTMVSLMCGRPPPAMSQITSKESPVMTRTHPHHRTSSRAFGGSLTMVLIALVLIGAAAVLIIIDPAPKSVLPTSETPDTTAAPEEPAPTTASTAQDRPAPPPRDRPVDPPLVLDRDTVDFGYVLLGDTVVEDVVLFNSADFDLNVEKLHTACPCTQVEVSPRHIPPGSTAVLTMTYTAQGYPHVAPRRSTRIQLAEYPGKMVTVYTHASVGREIRINADRNPIINAMAGELRVESYDDEPFRILKVDGRDPDFVDFNPETDEPRSQYLVRYDFASTRPSGYAPRGLHIVTDRASEPMADIQVRMPANTLDPTTSQPLSWLPEHHLLHLGTLTQPGQTVEKTVLLVRTRPEGIEQLAASIEPANTPSVIGTGTQEQRSGQPAVSVEVVSVEQGTKSARDYLVTLRFSFQDDIPPGLHHDELTLSTPNGNFTQLNVVSFVPATE